MPRWLSAFVQRLRRASCGLCADNSHILPTTTPTAHNANQTNTSTQQLLNPGLTTTPSSTLVPTPTPTPNSSLPIEAPHGAAISLGADQTLSEPRLPGPASQAPRSKALLIGIHYREHVSNFKKVKDGWDILTTPGRDVKNIHNLLTKHGYDDFRILLDAPHDGAPLDPTLNIYGEPTRDAILEGLEWLVHGARDGDRLFLHYSGHGDQVETTSSSESDGFDEALVPLTKDGVELYIRDNELADITKTLDARCTLLALFDCCHSGTMLDLEHRFPLRLSQRRPMLNTRLLPSNRPKRLSLKQLRAATSPISPTDERGPPSKRNTMLKHTGTVQNMLRLPFDNNGQVLRIPIRQTGMFNQNRQETATSEAFRFSSASLVAPVAVHPQLESLQFADIGLLERVMSPEPMEPLDGTTSINEEFRFPSLQITPDPGMNDARNHTFGHYQTPEQDDAKLAQVIAISACLDAENVFDDDFDGGLLTSTFIDCMRYQDNQNGIELGKMRQYFLTKFMARTKRIHRNCPPTPNEGKHCGNPKCKLPVIPPQPLFTGSVFLNPELLIRL